MGFAFSKDFTPPSEDTSTDRQGYTRIEPAFGISRLNAVNAPASNSSAGNNGVIRTFRGRDGVTITLNNNVVFCTWKNDDPEISIERDVIYIKDEFDCRMELEGSHEVQISNFQLRTRRVLEHGGQKGYCLGINTTTLEPQSLEIDQAKSAQSLMHSDILTLTALKNSAKISLRILLRNTNTQTKTTVGVGRTDFSIEPVNSSGVVWIRIYY